ncbi:AtpZ/AtpI family protein [Lacinutrix mariniflava]|uniref:AtpZ/AtpI family protein n=1 Tax=Lacinutrix mariniflava TaxID=342955 RepID=UPI0023AA20A0|nr:AtpZ/AtpI family protein [Lacinutrix mariniflava]
MSKKPKKQLSNYVKFTTIAFQMIATIGLLTLFGIWLDSKFPNNYSLYTVIFSLLGVLFSMYQVIKKVTSMNNEK